MARIVLGKSGVFRNIDGLQETSPKVGDAVRFNADDEAHAEYLLEQSGLALEPIFGSPYKRVIPIAARQPLGKGGMQILSDE